MRDFGDVGGQFYETVQIVGGPKTRAILQRGSDLDQPGAEFAAPKLSCRVRHDSLISAGQVLKVPGGDYYLVSDHSGAGSYRTHHLFRCDRQMVWTRPSTGTDLLTGLPKSDVTPDAMGTIWVMYERVRREFVDLTMRLSQERHLVAVGAGIQTGDFLDGITVDRVGTYLGIHVLELQS